MFYTFVFFVLLALALIVVGIIWDAVVDLHDARLRRRLKEEAVPDPHEAWQRIRWRKPLRQFIPPLLLPLGILLLVNMFGFIPLAKAQDKKEYELSRLLANIAVPVAIICIINLNWRQWRRYRITNSEHREHKQER